jgi:deoxyribose-phosphate aldolase
MEMRLHQFSPIREAIKRGATEIDVIVLHTETAIKENK